MDVLYYWKDYEADRRAGRLGYFQSSKEKLAALHEAWPDFIWVVKTPLGRKGEVQLLGRLRWSDTLCVPAKLSVDKSHIFYKPHDPLSIWFDEQTSLQSIDSVTCWLKRHHPVALRSNFQGANGQQGLHKPAVAELEALCKGWSATAFQVA